MNGSPLPEQIPTGVIFNFGDSLDNPFSYLRNMPAAERTPAIDGRHAREGRNSADFD